MTRSSKLKRTIVPVLLALLPCSVTLAATNIWQVDLTMNEFEGTPGGFDNDAQPLTLQSRASAPSAVRNYDIIRQTGTTASGQALMGEGQDGVTDLTLRTHIIEGNDGRWFRTEAIKRRNSYLGDVTVDNGTSRSGDFSVIAYEFTVGSHLEVTAADFGVRLASANGLGELYEWTFVTLGGLGDAPFDTAELSNYDHLIYNDLGASTFFNLDGTRIPGATATDAPIPTGKTISQFLAGNATDDGQFVEQGWYALDDAAVIVRDGVESNFGNPGSGTSSLLEKTVTGADLGLSELDAVEKFTVWFGFYDVAFDTDGDGFTRTNSNQDAQITRLSLGNSVAPVPEPSAMALLPVFLLGLARRKR